MGRTTVSACIAAALLAAPATAQEAGRGRIVAATRFDGSVVLPAVAGSAKSFRLSLGSLTLSGARRFEVPDMGFYVASLVSGDVLTAIGGQAVGRHTGDSWSVQVGQTMVVQLQGRSESALLEILKVAPASPAR
jgi:hypothetical protein